MGHFGALKGIEGAERLAAAGRHADVVGYIDGRAELACLLETSPTLALLYGTAHARLGRHDAGERWVGAALEGARQRGDATVELRALNVRGAIALDAGYLRDAGRFFGDALTQATRLRDDGAVGRCANNLGIIASLRGEHGRAVGSYAMARAAFERAELFRGVAEVQHNLARSHMDRDRLEAALVAADGAVSAAHRSKDRALEAQTLAGRAEIRVRLGDLRAARCEVEKAVAVHRELRDAVGEAEDLRVLALVQVAAGDLAAGERLLGDVIVRAEEHSRPILMAEAERDLAHLLDKLEHRGAAVEMARRARSRFAALGADGAVRRLDAWLEGLV